MRLERMIQRMQYVIQRMQYAIQRMQYAIQRMKYVIQRMKYVRIHKDIQVQKVVAVSQSKPTNVLIKTTCLH
jgi:hypothetical protein